MLTTRLLLLPPKPFATRVTKLVEAKAAHKTDSAACDQLPVMVVVLLGVLNCNRVSGTFVQVEVAQSVRLIYCCTLRKNLSCTS